MCTKERPYAAETIGKPSQWQIKSDCSSIIHMHLSDMEKLFFVTFTVSRTVKSCPLLTMQALRVKSTIAPTHS